MSNQKQFMKSKLRLRGLTTLAVLLFWMQLTTVPAIETTKTTAPVTITPALESTLIANELKVLRQSATPATLQLAKQQNDEEFEMKHQLSKTSKQSSSTAELIHTTSSFAPSTFASSNVPATTTNEAKTETAKKAQDEMKKLISTTKNIENNNEWGSKIIETDTEQATKSVGEEQQQGTEPLTTEVSWQKETDMQQQSTGNSRNSKIDMKFAATKAVSTQTQMPHFSTTPHTLSFKENTAKGLKYLSEQTKLAQFKQKEIVADEIKPTKEEIDDLTLTLDEDKQAIEDFKPLIKDANEKLLKERTIFSSKPKFSNEDWKQNLMPNELDYDNNKPLLSKNYEHNINWSPYLHPATPVTDFTGKLLQDQDGVITEIEQKFRLNEFSHDGDSDNIKFSPNSDSTTRKTSLELTQTTTFSKDPQPASSANPVNHKTVSINKSKSPVEFIERRVKKSFDFPMHRVASDAQHLQQHFDFANTKFNSNNNEQHNLQEPKTSNEGQQQENTQQTRPQPEFSTTKFYNSKELYNEMLQHKTKQQQAASHAANFHDKHTEEFNNRAAPSLSLNSFAVLHSPKIAKLEELHETKDVQQQQKQKSLAIKKVTVKATKHNKDATFNTEDSPTTATTTDTTTTTANAKSIQTTLTPNSTPIKGLSTNTLTEMPLAALVKTKKFQKELKRAKLLIKSMLPLQTAPETTISRISNSNNNNNNSELKGFRQQNATTISAQPTQIPLKTKIISQTTTSLQTLPYTATTTTAASAAPTLVVTEEHSLASALIPLASSTPSPKTSSHPILRPRILSRLQEKINSLECELQNLPQDSHLWRGNETHELLLPIMICKPLWTPTSWFANNRWVIRNSRNCSATTDTPENCKSDKDCTAMMVSWEGESEIQSGDILIVEINDALLTPKDINLTTSAHNTQVYQVTRSGHEHCDATEGILLDITPLIVDGRKLVTLYDKDLTEGVNLLIVVSELWGNQCVRLKVTTKTENCGENSDCSGKGICFSNYDMEEYECQCCSGFAGPHCEEIDACTPSPCTNNGICVDLSQGHEGNSYQCLCPYGYTGKNCQYELDPCNPAECMNGGSCVGNSTHFRCDCTPGYTGPLCQHSLNECESSPCIHGICVDQEDGFRCFCQPGFAGELCNFEYNECESNPCQNGGECIDHIGSFECHCSKGYTGNRCQIKVDFCANKPCPEGRRCIDHGNEYSCECLGGRNGPDCNEMQRTQCNVNPCTHGGTCWSSGDSFYCACRPGYTGTMCEDEFVVETVVSSSEFMVDDTSARNFNDKSFGSSVVLKSPIELHNAYTAAIVLALVIFFVALYLTICHCKVNQTYRKFSTRTYGFLPILGFRLRTKQATSKISRHWLSGKGLGIGNPMRGGDVGGTTSSSSTSALQATTATSTQQRNNVGHLPTAKASSGTQKHTHVGQLNERPFQRHLAMNLENDMYYTVDFSENSQHSPLIQ